MIRHRTAIACLISLAALLPLQALAQEAGEAQAQPTFDVLEYRVLGNKTLDNRAIESAVYPHLGSKKSIADVDQARAALEGAYKAAGYGTVFVDIPEQDVTGGIVRLRVTEGTLRRVKIEGERYFSAAEIRSELPAARAGAAPNLPAVQEELAAINLKTRDRQVVPVLAPGPRPGTVDLTLKVDDQLPVHGSVEINNEYTADTTRLRALASLSYDNLFNRLDSLSLQYQTAPQSSKEVDVFAASYAARLESGNRLAFYYVNSNSDIASLGVLSVLGKGSIYGSQLVVPLMNEASASHTLTLGASYKDFSESIQLDSSSNFNTPISYGSLSLTEASVWRSEKRQWQLVSSANFGLRGRLNTPEEFADKRYRARPNFFYVRLDGSVRSEFFGGTFVTARIAGQYAVEPIISNEQFSIGGSDGVRGYLEAEELSDVGMKATLQFNSPLWHVFNEHYGFDAFVFSDYGFVSTLKTLPEESRKEELSSVGAGFNLGAWDHFTGSLTWAYPLVSGGRTLADDSRILFKVNSTW